jgi:hypothetical protein
MEEEKEPVAITVEGDSKKDTKKNKKDADKKDEVCMLFCHLKKCLFISSYLIDNRTS